MRKFIVLCGVGAAALLAQPARADGPSFTRAGGISGPGYAVTAAGDAAFHSASIGGSPIPTAATLASVPVLPAVATASRTLAARFSDRLNVKDFGALGDLVTVAGTFTVSAGSPVLSSAAGVFNPAMVGASIAIPAAGPAAGLLTTTVASYTSPTSITLAAPASTALAAAVTHLDIGHDDTAAIGNAILVATGHAPIGVLAALNYYAKAGVYWLGIGPNPNGSGRVDFPDGAYLISAAIGAQLQQNGGLALVGNGPSHVQLVQSVAGDLIDVTFTPNPGGAGTDAGGNGNDATHAGAWPGQAVVVRGMSLETSYVGANSGVALNVAGIPLLNANQPPQQVIEDLYISSRGGWAAGTQGWGTGVQFTDPDNLFMSRIETVDHRGTPAMVAFHLISDAPAGGYPGHDHIVCIDCGQVGGLDYFVVTGAGFQGITLDRPYWVNDRNGIDWRAAAGSGSGSLAVTAASGGSGVADVTLANISTVFSAQGFYYNNHTAVGTSWHGVLAQSVNWFQETNDQVVAPPGNALMPASGSALAAAYSYGVTVVGASSGATAAVPSIISSTSVSGSDFAFSAEGLDTTLVGDACALNGPTAAPGVCFTDTYAGTDVRFHPHFATMVPTDNLVYADAGHDTVVHASPAQLFGSGLEIGMPGITLPGVGAGNAGTIDWHASMPSDWTAGANGTLAHQVDYDCRESVDEGSSTLAGQGRLSLACLGGFKVDGPVLTPTLGSAGQSLHLPGSYTVADGPLLTPYVRLIGFPEPLTPADACSAGTFGAGATGSLIVQSFCAASGDWRWSPTSTGVPGVTFNWPGSLFVSGLVVDGSPTSVAVTQYPASVAADNTAGNLLACSPTAVLPSASQVLPPNPKPWQLFHLSAECTVTAMAVTGGLSSSAYTPQVIGAPAGLSPTTPVTFVYDNSNRVWARW